MRRGAFGVVGLAAVTFGLGGCTSVGTHVGMNFGLPAELLKSPNEADVDHLVASLEAREQAYVQAANGAINGPQLFDVPLLAAATAGVAAAAFNTKNDLGPSAATLAAGAFGFRNYYRSGDRYAPYVTGARSLSCLHRVLVDLKGKDLQGALVDWNHVLPDVRKAETKGELEKEAERVGSMIDAVPDKFVSAALQVDNQVMAKLKAPTAPDAAAIIKQYRDTQAVEDNNKTANAGLKSVVDGVREKSASYDAKVKTRLGQRALIDSVTELDGKIDRCTAMSL